jgi:hypothetical protein
MFKRSNVNYANVVGTLALFVALGGTSYAALSLPRDSVGSLQIRKGAVRGSELHSSAVTSRAIRDRSVALRDISRSTRESLRGQPGARGATGPPGPPGPSGVTYWAAVDSGGGVARGNVLDVSHVAANEYNVILPRSADDCVATATLAAVQNGANLEEPPPGRITVAHLFTRVRVRTYDANGNPAPLPFNVIVAC